MVKQKCCRKGHKMNARNLYITSTGRRCRKCKILLSKNYYARNAKRIAKKRFLEKRSLDKKRKKV